MQFTVQINQAKALEWGINLQQATLFAFIYHAAVWATKEGEYWNISKGKIIDELPILTDKPDTVYRLRKALVEKGLIENQLINGKDFYRVTEKGLEWNSIQPNEIGRKSEGRKKIRPRSEKFPIQTGKISDVSNNQDQITKDQIQERSRDDENEALFNEFWEAYPRKTGKKQAEKSWRRLKADRAMLGTILENVRQRLIQGDWRLSEKQYIPHPATYLNNNRWQDEVVPRETPETPPSVRPSGRPMLLDIVREQEGRQ